MSNAPVYEIDLKSFWRDPYPDLKAMRETTPIAYVPQLGATLLTKRDDIFDIRQDSSASIAFDAGPHFCADAWASRSLIADCAMPAIFEQLPNLRPDGEVEFGGWAFRGPLALPVAWDV